MERLVQHLSRAIPDSVYCNGHPEYAESLNTYFSAQESQIKPTCVVRPKSTFDVSKTVSTLVEANSKKQDKVKFAIRSGGHTSFAGCANEAGGVTIDLRGLNSIKINDEQSQATIGAGASWGEVYRTLDAQGLALPGGRHSQVGVGGLTLGGGLSHFSSHVGLVCDNVLEFEIVLASGSVVQITESESEYKDLFLALRGGSNNFGIVTHFTFRIFRQGRLWGGTLIHGIETKDQQLRTFYDFAGNPEYDASASLIHSFGMSEQGSGFVNGVVYTKPQNEPKVFKPFLKLDPIHVNTLRELSLTELTREQDDFNENGLCQIMTSTTYYLHLPLLRRTYDLWDASCALVKPFSGMRWSITLQPIHPTVIAKSPFLQSAIPTLPLSEENLHQSLGSHSPPADRTVVIAQLTGTWSSSSDSPAVEAAARQLIDDISAAAKAESMQTGYMYLNYAHAGQEVWSDGSEKGEERKEWLRGVSRKVDPEGVFQTCVPGGFKLF